MDYIGFYAFEIWKWNYIEIMKGIEGDLCFFLILGYTEILLKYYWKYLNYFALFCFVAAAAIAATTAGHRCLSFYYRIMCSIRRYK